MRYINPRYLLTHFKRFLQVSLLFFVITLWLEIKSIIANEVVNYFVRSPDSIQQSLLEASPIAQLSPSDLPPFWRGSICAQEIAKVLVSAYLVSGSFNVPREVFTVLINICHLRHKQTNKFIKKTRHTNAIYTLC